MTASSPCIASWGVDFVKVDDISRPYHRNRPEIEAVRRAIDGSGRPMILSLSPGETPLDAAAHVAEHANMWRISDDFWDEWPPARRPVRAARQLGAASPRRRLARRRHAAARPARARRTTDALHPRRAAHDDESVGDRALAPDHGRRPARARRRRPWPCSPTTPSSPSTSTAATTASSTATNSHVVWTARDTRSRDVYLALFNLGEEADEVGIALDSGRGSAAERTSPTSGRAARSDRITPASRRASRPMAPASSASARSERVSAKRDPASP